MAHVRAAIRKLFQRVRSDRGEEVHNQPFTEFNPSQRSDTDSLSSHGVGSCVVSDDGYNYVRASMVRMYGRLVVPATLDEWRGIRPNGHVIWTDIDPKKRDLTPREREFLEGRVVEPSARIPLLEDILRSLGFQQKPLAHEVLGWYHFVRGTVTRSDHGGADYDALSPGPNSTYVDKRRYDDGFRTEVCVHEREPSDTLYSIARALLDHDHRVAMPPVDKFHTHIVYYAKDGEAYRLHRVIEAPDLGQRGGQERIAVIKEVAGSRYEAVPTGVQVVQPPTATSSATLQQL